MKARGKRMRVDAMAHAALSAVAVIGAGAALTAHAQPAPYPARPVRMIVPFAPGGGADLGARQIAAKLSEQLGQQFVIDNRGGSGELIGMEIAALAAPDGYTLLFTSASYAATMAMRKSAHATLKNLTPVMEIGASPYVLGVHPSLPASLKGLLELARDKPGPVHSTRKPAYFTIGAHFAISARITAANCSGVSP